MLLGFCFLLTPGKWCPLPLGQRGPSDALQPPFPWDFMSLGKTFGLLVRVPVHFSRATEASAVLCKVPLMLRISCLPSPVPVTFDCVLLTHEHSASTFCSVSFVLFFLEWKWTVLLRSCSPAGQKTYPPPPPPVTHDGKSSCLRGSVSCSHLCAFTRASRP